MGNTGNSDIQQLSPLENLTTFFCFLCQSSQVLHVPMLVLPFLGHHSHWYSYILIYTPLSLGLVKLVPFILSAFNDTIDYLVIMQTFMMLSIQPC